MRYVFFPLAFCAIATFVACNPSSSTTTTTTNTTSQSNSAPATSTITHSTTDTTQSVPPISSAHGGGSVGGGGSATSAPNSSMPSSSEKPDVDTAQLDAKIEKAEAKAKSQGASEADKLAAASAYVERGNIYYNAGRPNLYKFALGDFRRALRYQPDNAEARSKIEQMVEIYNSMGRPVPNNGNEP